jgi:ElaB/YqjD/DUF883 family membrane-anchored ribosome-binding protein
MEATENATNDKGELRGKLEAAVEKAKALCERLEERAVEAAKVTDKTIRDHPYHSVGIAFGVGLLIGVLANRCRRD